MAKREGIMLAYAYTEKMFKKLGSPLIVQPKVEGDRIRAIIAGGYPSLLSSSAAIKMSLPVIQHELDLSPFANIELDGEAYVHGSHHSWIRGVVSRTKHLHPEHSKMQYHVYDIVSSSPQHNRLVYLWDTLTNYDLEHIRPVPFEIIYNSDELQVQYDKYLEQGYEGIIMRAMNAPYVRKKTVGMLKLKPRLSDYFEIMDVVEEVSIEGEAKGTFGAFVCLTNDGGEFFNVGSGPTKAQRDLLWRYREDFKGHEVKIRFQNYTNARSVPKMQSIDKEWLKIIEEILT